METISYGDGNAGDDDDDGDNGDVDGDGDPKNTLLTAEKEGITTESRAPSLVLQKDSLHRFDNMSCTIAFDERERILIMLFVEICHAGIGRSSSHLAAMLGQHFTSISCEYE